MTPDEVRLVNGLCQRIADEKDPFVFQQLVEQLNELLSRKEKRLTSTTKAPDPH